MKKSLNSLRLTAAPAFQTLLALAGLAILTIELVLPNIAFAQDDEGVYKRPCEDYIPDGSGASGDWQPKPDGADSNNDRHICCGGKEHKKMPPATISVTVDADHAILATLNGMAGMLKHTVGGCSFQRGVNDKLTLSGKAEYKCCGGTQDYNTLREYKVSGSASWQLECRIFVPTPIPSLNVIGSLDAGVKLTPNISLTIDDCKDESKKCLGGDLTGHITVSGGVSGGWGLVSGTIGGKAQISGSANVCAYPDNSIGFEDPSVDGIKYSVVAEACEFWGLLCQDIEFEL